MIQRHPFGLFTDLDGTISEITRTPGEAQVLPACRHFLSLLSAKIPVVAVISGRSVETARTLVGLNNLVYIGSHGMERWIDGHSEYAPGLEHFEEIIRSTLDAITPYISRDGIIVEDKKVTASIHYRLSPDPETARETIIAAIKSTPFARDLRLMQNKMIVELLPLANFNKGTSVHTLINEFKLGGAIYLGDDITDVDAFKALHELPGQAFLGLAIAVTGAEMPPEVAQESDFTLNGVADVARFLTWLDKTLAER